MPLCRGVIEAVEQSGYLTLLAQNATDALLTAQDPVPALFIIHIRPETYWNLAMKIRTNKALKRFPILFVADSDLSDNDSERAASLGVQGFIKLLADKDALALEIGRVMSLRATR